MIKSDRWIIRMGTGHQMIEPFEPKQVNVVETAAGPKPVISYGVSSYGYDIRVGRHFKVLKISSSPAASSGGSIDPRLTPAGDDIAVIDPKNFDVSSFEDFEGDVCIIPPHGMAI